MSLAIAHFRDLFAHFVTDFYSFPITFVLADFVFRTYATGIDSEHGLNSIGLLDLNNSPRRTGTEILYTSNWL